ncbi:CTP synthase [Nocardia sp. RB20]|uniref:CTP synthase n=1 Tax=Nocardia macrotermitis TaxID=2585198 RepID=A0A7K0DAQ3_9NOCA|nr:CTP synthase [Nocardia macrotermitis]
MGRDKVGAIRYARNPREQVTVALVGKYVDLPDAYLPVTEALRAGGFARKAKVNIRWVQSDECETPAGAQAHLIARVFHCAPAGA